MRAKLILAILLGVCIQTSAQDELLDILTRELEREFEVLSAAKEPVYYMDYQVWDLENQIISANLGSLVTSSVDQNRNAVVNLRIGSYGKDHTYDNGKSYDNLGYGRTNAIAIPLENNEVAIAQHLWMLTNARYQEAKERYKRVVAGSEESSEVADFSREEPEVYLGKIQNYDLQKDEEEIREILMRLSAMFLEDEDIISGEVSLNRNTITKYFVSTEGSRIAHQVAYNFVSINAQIRDEKGELIPMYKTRFTFDLDQLPDEEQLGKDIEAMMETLTALQSATIADAYSGPAILHPKAAGVFFHEIFGHRIEGSRLKSDFDSQTFTDKVGALVLPKTMSVYMDPTIDELRGTDLIGHYVYDDEGIKGERTTVVKDGVLTNFLMTRKPLEKFPNSNGHARAQAGFNPISRQSNLIVSSSKTISSTDLRKQLIKECKKQNKEYGYYFKEVQGGFTNTDRFSPNAFNITPTVVYRIYVDGRPDELVRGVNLIGTPLSMFEEISHASEEQDTFNGFCGAESGSVPVSATSHGLLVRRIETQKQFRSANEANVPFLSRPVSN